MLFNKNNKNINYFQSQRVLGIFCKSAFMDWLQPIFLLLVLLFLFLASLFYFPSFVSCINNDISFVSFLHVLTELSILVLLGNIILTWVLTLLEYLLILSFDRLTRL